jgi:hypothetical protein
MQALQPGPGDDTPATTTTMGPAAVLACMHASLYQSKKPMSPSRSFLCSLDLGR